ncbi:MAG: hypothetical protein JST92_05310 [Deltaproteobacteria bacterium]|nr:hypothetical protein [Deltaproteobacteria bacterium]
MAANAPPSGRFSTLLLEGLDHYRKGKMMEAVRAWEEAYLLEPSNLRAREFLRSALERIHAHMGAGGNQSAPPPQLNPFAAMAPPAPSLPPAPKAAVPYGQPLPGAGPFAAQPKGNTDPLARLPPQYGDGEPEADPNGPAPDKTLVNVPARAPGTAHPWLPQRPPEVAPEQKARTATPWDDGPSVALPQNTDPGVTDRDAGVAWAIHSDPKPVPTKEVDETEVWQRGARELVALNDFSGALELTNKILALHPNDKDAQAMHKTCEENLTQMFESRLGSMDRRPRVVLKPDEVIWLNLDPRAGFVLAQIDGEVSFEDLYAICGLSRLDTARILSQLLEEGVIASEAAAMAARATR